MLEPKPSLRALAVALWCALSTSALACSPAPESDGAAPHVASSGMTAFRHPEAGRGHPLVPATLSGSLRAAFIRQVQADSAHAFELLETPEGSEWRTAPSRAGTMLSVSESSGRVRVARNSAELVPRWRAEGSVPDEAFDVALTTTRWGAADEMVSMPEPSGSRMDAGQLTLYRGPSIDEWYTSGSLGIEQGFIIHDLPPGAAARGELAIEIQLDGLEASVEGGEIALRTSGSASADDPVARYGEAVAEDAAGQVLAVSIGARGDTVVLALSVTGAVLPIDIDPLVWVKQQKVTAGDGDQFDNLGSSVAVDGNYAVVGAMGDDDKGSNAGAAYVFVRSGTTWSMQQKLKANDGSAGDEFGWSVAIDGATIIVGAPFDDPNGSNSGSAYPFTRTNTTWTQQPKLTPSLAVAGDRFGYAVSVSSKRVANGVVSTAVVGAPFANGTRGTAYVFYRATTTWTQQASLVALDGLDGDLLSYSASSYGDTVLLGAPFEEPTGGTDRGAAYFYTRTGSTWSQTQKVVPTDPTNQKYFGRAVAIGFGGAIVGANGDDAVATDSGAAYVFVHNGTSWVQQGKLTSSEALANDQFGLSVDIYGDRAIVASPYAISNNGAAWLFARTGSSWSLFQTFVEVTVPNYGGFAAIDDKTAAVGAPGDNSGRGAAFIYVEGTQTTNGDACTTSASCASGFCVDGYCCNSACNSGTCDSCALPGLLGTCSPVAGSTVCRAAVDQCDVAETCGGSTTCPADGKKPNGTSCNDSNACTQTDTCQAGVCSGSNPVTCPAPPACHGQGTCNPATGTCSAPTPRPDGFPCSDGNACTVPDTCSAGQCQPGGPAQINDSNPCTVDACDPVAGVSHTPVAAGTNCSNGNACDGYETCNAQAQCTSGAAWANGTSCPGDDNPCTADACQQGVCVSTVIIGQPCNDNNPCTTSDSCNATGQCEGTGTGTSCSDGSACNGEETCVAGACEPGTPVVTDDGDPATLDACDPATGAVLHSDCSTALDQTVSTSLAAAAKCLYVGPNPIQIGIAGAPFSTELDPLSIAAPFDPQRIAVVRGRVVLADGSPVEGVLVHAPAQLSSGRTFTRSDGRYDLAVDGGALINLVYTKFGVPTVHRQVPTRWQETSTIDDVVVLPYDDRVSLIELDLPDTQVARGSPVVDGDGMRTATVIVPAGTAADMMLPDGSSVPLTEMSVRLTEYTVGEMGPNAMPAALPPTSAYTYAVELSVDEAVEAGAERVEFSGPTPLVFFVENFLDFPTGGIVPVGLYDRTSAAWVPEPNGKVIQITAVANGLAEVDTDGDGGADNIGISADEREALASLYEPGRSLWRVERTHFSPCDLNWPNGPPDDSCTPNDESCDLDDNPDDGPDDGPEPPPDDDQPCEKPTASTIECQNQVLGESVPIAGTAFQLQYRTSRAHGWRQAYTLRIPLTGSWFPPSLRSIELEIEVAGQKITESFPCPCTTNHVVERTWNGEDAFGRRVQGVQPALVRIGYTYDRWYTVPPNVAASFGLPAYTPLTQARDYITLWASWKRGLGTLDAAGQGLGGWDLDVHHTYDPVGRVLYRGDGTRRHGDAIAAAIRKVAGGGPPAVNDNGIPATQVALTSIGGLAVSGDGSLYISHGGKCLVRRVDATGIITTVAGTWDQFGVVCGATGDGGPATAARLGFVWDIEVGPDGSLYILHDDGTVGTRRVRRVTSDGIISTVAGCVNTPCSSASGTAALSFSFDPVVGLAVGSDGTAYVSEGDGNGPSNGGAHRVMRIGTDGVVTQVGGLQSTTPRGLAVGGDGNLYIAMTDGTVFPSREVVKRVGIDGSVEMVAGGGSPADGIGDGGAATNAKLYRPRDVAVGADGAVYIADGESGGSGAGRNRVRRVADGIISTVSGGGPVSQFAGDLGPAAAARFVEPHAVAVRPDGGIEIADGAINTGGLVLRVHPALPGLSFLSTTIPSDDGEQLYVFDPAGRHTSTRSTRTGAFIWQFGYDLSGRLTSITDAANNVTTIQRDGTGKPTAIIGPYGHSTALTLDADGYLETVTNPGSEAHAFTYWPGGLLKTFDDPRGGMAAMEYDPMGRLTRDDDAANGFWDLERSTITDGHRVTMATALGRTTLYDVQRLPTGVEKRTTIFPSGVSAVQEIALDDSRKTTLADGTVTNQSFTGDPRFSMQLPFEKSRTTTTPGGKVLSVTSTRSVTLANPADPLSMTAMTDTMIVNGKPWTRAWNAAARTITTTSPLSRQVVTTTDTAGRVTQVAVPGVTPWDLAYDTRGRLRTTTQGVRVTTRDYDAASNLDTLTDAMSRVTSFDHDPVGRVTLETRPDLEDIVMSYDDSGNMTSITPPAQPAHGMSHTPLNLLESYDPPPLTTGPTPTTWEYNDDRQVDLVTRPDAGTIDYDYDSAGRLWTVTFPGGATTHTYHPTTAKLQTIAGPDGATLTFGFDGGLLTSTAWSGSITGDVGRTYDNFFRVTGETVNGGSSVSFGYDDDGLLTSAGGLVITRDPQNGRVTDTALSNVTEAYSYNEFGEVSDYHAKFSGATLLHVVYVRDNLGRITEKTETIDGTTHVCTYFYDGAGRLEHVEKDAVTTASYVYYPNGNRFTRTTPGGAETGTYDEQDRILTYGTKSYTHTPAGELETVTDSATSGITTYTYDALGNLKSVELADGRFVEYLVDGENHRILKKVDGVVVKGWLWRDALQIVAELDASGALVSRFVYAEGANAPEAMLRGGMTYRLVKDHLGSVRTVLNASTGTVVQRIDYDEFGRATISCPSGSFPSCEDFQPFGFAGGLYDADTRLVRFGARDYDAETGRWINKDPIRFDGGVNLYAYAQNDPVNALDPEGTQEHDPNALASLCAKHGAPCPAYYGHPTKGQVGGLYACDKTKAKTTKASLIKFTCSYRYPDGDLCTFFNGGPLGICNSFLPSCDPTDECCDPSIAND